MILIGLCYLTIDYLLIYIIIKYYNQNYNYNHNYNQIIINCSIFFFQKWGTINARLAYFLLSNFQFLFTRGREKRKTPFYCTRVLVLINIKISKN